ncbi:MAG: hypothetical protein KJN71_07010, partial [Acidimicrobiia bacterium]|nr:hypothetical protein [Acidimicrobiia bacterium]
EDEAEGTTEAPTTLGPTRAEEFGQLIIEQPMRYLYQGAQILTIGKRTTPQVGDAAQTTATGSNGGIFTFAVPPEVAQMLYSIPDNALVFSLVSRDYTLRPLPSLTGEEFTLLPGEDATKLHPCGPLGQAACDPESVEAADETEDAPESLPASEDIFQDEEG